MTSIGRVNVAPSDSPFAPRSQPAAPPYALTMPTFRFRALAALAGRAPLGGPREVVLATYLLARLVDDCRPARELPQETRAARSSAARNWLANTALPPAVRSPLIRLAEATEGEVSGIAIALGTAIVATTSYLDDAARFELERLAQAIVP